ncbi:hypothetical protein TIFTF001_024701 [Ficus carica]|uniref:Uncharacterized protein n=1 Tax=Ficus carica TaxID=3494 RepID=A0AA88DDJ5_FICCA|nr:hypothetical protein TIFTF001_024701 [Ficus carica]
MEGGRERGGGRGMDGGRAPIYCLVSKEERRERRGGGRLSPSEPTTLHPPSINGRLME